MIVATLPGIPRDRTAIGINVGVWKGRVDKVSDADIARSTWIERMNTSPEIDMAIVIATLKCSAW